MISVKHNISEMIKKLEDIAKRQLPFAIAKALTDTAKDVQAEVLRTLPIKFNLRTNWWKPSSKFGFKVKPATKNRHESEVYSLAPWMFLQEEGGIKVPHQGRKMIAIPTDQVRRNKKDLITKTQKPAYLMHQAKNKAFIRTTKSGFDMILQRTTKKNYPLKALYLLTPDAKVTPRLFFEETGRRIVRTRFHINFEHAFYQAMRTATGSKTIFQRLSE